MIPDEKSEIVCSRIINNLSQKYQSVSFLPHITLASASDLSEQKLAEAAKKIASETEVFPLSVKTVQCKKFPYQKLTAGVERSETLNDLHQKTDTYLKGDYAKKEYPHISFLYSSLPCGQLRNDVSEIERDHPRTISIEKIALVHCKGTPEDWRTLYIWKLNQTKV